jgi:hypothetical protein
MWLVDDLLDVLLATMTTKPTISGDPPPRHPYEARTALRSRLPGFLINLGVAAKARDCESVGAKHAWYNQDGTHSACYHCEVVRPGQLWKKT